MDGASARRADLTICSLPLVGRGWGVVTCVVGGGGGGGTQSFSSQSQPSGHSEHTGPLT